jgi:hypothetical protein
MDLATLSADNLEEIYSVDEINKSWTFDLYGALSTPLEKGGKLDKYGRKLKYNSATNTHELCNRKHKPIYLTLPIYSSWKDIQGEAEYVRSIDSDFATYLFSQEYRGK